MTQAKAQTVASALIGLGYSVKVDNDGVGFYTVYVTSQLPIDIAAVNTFVTNQAVTGKITQAILT